MSNKTLKILSDEQIDEAFAGWDKSCYTTEMENNKRGCIAKTLFKYACGYASGRVMRTLCDELGLIDFQTEKLTKLGKEFLYLHYEGNKGG